LLLVQKSSFSGAIAWRSWLSTGRGALVEDAALIKTQGKTFDPINPLAPKYPSLPGVEGSPWHTRA
jgi:hypothetical protein